MFTPQEVSEKTFPKASGFNNGYGMAAVDEFLDALTEDYTALYKDNAALKAKLKVLAEKVEEYRATEDAMRSTLLAAQKMADSMVADATTRTEQMVQQAQQESRKILEDAKNAVAVTNQDLAEKTAQARQKLELAQAELQRFVEESAALCRRQTEFLQQLPQMELTGPAQEEVPAQEAQPEETQEAPAAPAEEEQTAAPAPEQAAQPEEPAAQESSAEADKTEEEPEEDKQPTTVFEPVQPDTDFTREFRFDLEDLKFGHNYQSGKQ